uniref:NCK associated protein 5 n=1 Tax=Pseudonaja textilis TaxID=8673 RepID=A0A670Z589_PSETE
PQGKNSLSSPFRIEYMDSNKYIDYLLNQLEQQRWKLWKEKLSVARLQQEVARSKSDGTMREKLVHELEEERHLRFESEKRLQEMTLESERHRVQMCGLQQQFSRMEETVRNLLQSQGLSEPNGEESVPILKSYQETLMQEGKQCKTGVEDICMSDKHSRSENNSSEEERDKTKLLLERLKALEAENSALAMENKNQREQYERCLDEVANQVVQALLTQKDLREECLKLKTRVFDLEQQNQTLNVLFQQRMKPTSSVLLLICHLIQKDAVTLSLCLFFSSHQIMSSLNGIGPHQVYPRSSCSSSELSLSSACSEYSSSSSWNDGKACKKKVSSCSLSFYLLESCCQMRTLDSGIGTFPLPDSGNRSTGRHVSKQGLDLENEDFTSPKQPFPQAPSEKAQTLEREVPSTTNKSPGSVESVISHSASDPMMADRGVQALKSHLPKAASSGKMTASGFFLQMRCLVSACQFSLAEITIPSRPSPDHQDRALRVCTYSASSSSDTEMELEHETNGFGTGGEMLVDLMKNNKQGTVPFVHRNVLIPLLL